MKKLLCVIFIGIMGLGGSLWAIGDEQQDLDARLWKAVQAGDFESAREAIQDGADVNMKTAEGCTPLHHAVKAGKKEILQLLLAQGARMTFSIDLIRQRRLDQIAQTNVSMPTSDEAIRKHLVSLAIKAKQTYLLHSIFEDIAREYDEEKAYKEAVEFIKIINAELFNIEDDSGLIVINIDPRIKDWYVLPLQHLIVKFSDEKTTLLFMRALKEVLGDEAAKQVLFHCHCVNRWESTVENFGHDILAGFGFPDAPITIEYSYFTPIDLFVYQSSILSSKEEFLTFFSVVSAVFGENMIEDVLMEGNREGGNLLHFLLFYLAYNENICDSSLVERISIFLEAVSEYLGEEFLVDWVNSRDRREALPLFHVLHTNNYFVRRVFLNSENAYYSSSIQLKSILSTRLFQLACTPILLDIERELGEGQDTLVLAMHLLKQLIQETSKAPSGANIGVEGDPRYSANYWLYPLECMLKNEKVLQLLLSGFPDIESDKELLEFAGSLLLMLEEKHSDITEKEFNNVMLAVLLSRVNGVMEAINKWSSSRQKNARSVIAPAGDPSDEGKEKKVNTRPSGEGEEEAPPRKKQKTLLDEFNGESDNQVDELYTDDDDAWELSETEAVIDAGRVLTVENDFSQAMRGVDIGYGAHWREHLND